MLLLFQRGKTAHTRISSAIADDKQIYRGIEYVSRPNTTHTFRVSMRLTASPSEPNSYLCLERLGAVRSPLALPLQHVFVRAQTDNLPPKRATSVTPSNFAFGMHPGGVSVTQKSASSPSAAFFQNSSGASGVPLPQHSHSPDNFSGLVGITGRSFVFWTEVSCFDKNPGKKATVDTKLRRDVKQFLQTRSYRANVKAVPPRWRVQWMLWRRLFPVSSDDVAPFFLQYPWATWCCTKWLSLRKLFFVSKKPRILYNKTWLTFAWASNLPDIVLQ